MNSKRRIEREFGVPVPGEILPPEQWTRTALKQLPTAGPLDWLALFGRQAPIVVDLGCGNGRYLLGSAIWRPQCDHFGIDALHVVIRYATRRANQRGLRNIRFAVGDAAEFLATLVPPHSVQEIHLYHPQPHYGPDQVERRLVTPRFVADLHRALVPEGELFAQTDHPLYWRYMSELLPMFFDFTARPGPWPDAPKGRTRREIIALRRGMTVFRGQGRARADLDAATAERLAAELPPPQFEADRDSLELDELERE